MKALKRNIALIKIKLNNVTIRNKILVYNIVIIFIPIFVLALFANNISSHAIVNKALENSNRELALVDKNLQSEIKNFEGYARLLASDYRLQQLLDNPIFDIHEALTYIDTKKSLEDIVSNYTTPNINIVTSSVMTPDQFLLDIGYANNTFIHSIFDSTLYHTIVVKQSPYWTSLFELPYKQGFGSKDNVFAVSKAIISKERGVTLGIIMLYIKEQNIAASYTDPILDPKNKFYILNNEGIVISSLDKKELYQNFADVIHFNFNRNEGIPLLKEGSEKVVIDHINSLMTVRSFEKLNWKIINVVPIDEITKENKMIDRFILIVGTACLIIAFIGAFQLSYTIAKPILQLVKFMKIIKIGETNHLTDLKYGGEVGKLVVGFNLLMDRNDTLLREVYKEQKARRDYEFKLLQSQIKPHFLYNTLETIISFIKIGMYSEAITSTKSLAGFYRISLSKGNDIITIHEEVQLVRSYLTIQKYRYNNYLDYQIEVDDEISIYYIPKLTLQPIIENAIYHGIKPSKSGYLTIKGYKKDDTIIFEILDDGVGMTSEQIIAILKRNELTDKQINFGVSSVDARIKLLYGEMFGIEIESKLGEFTRVIIKLPLQDTLGDERDY